MLLSKPADINKVSVEEAVPWHKLYLSGFFVAAGNPKAIAFFTPFFPQFINPSEPLLQQMAIMCPTMAILDFSWVMFYALSTKKFLGFMKTHPTVLNRLGGSALVSASIFLMFSSRSSNL